MDALGGVVTTTPKTGGHDAGKHVYIYIYIYIYIILHIYIKMYINIHINIHINVSIKIKTTKYKTYVCVCM